MRSRGAAFAADFAYFIALFHTLTRADFELGQVQIGANQTLAVVKHDQSALVVKSRFGKTHERLTRCVDRRSDWRGEVSAIVRPLGHAVQDPLAAEPGRVTRAIHRRDEAGSEIVRVDVAGETGGLALGLLGDAREQGGIGWSNLILWQAVDALDVVVDGGYGDLVLG